MRYCGTECDKVRPWSQLQARKGAMVLADWWDRVAGRAGKREVFPSRFGEAAVYAMPAEDGSLVRMLNVGGVLQSATYLDERWATCPFAYLRSFDHLFEAALSEAPDPLVVNRVLMLGGASGSCAVGVAGSA